MIAAAVATVAGAALPPVVYQAATRDYVVRLRVAPELQALPAVYSAFREQVERDFAAFEATAKSDMAQSRAQDPGGPMARNPEVEQVEVDFVARTPHLIGFVRRDYRDAHGAHAGYVVSCLLYDVQSGRRLAATDLLRPGVDRAPLDAALATRASAAKRSRGVREGLGDGFVKPGAMTWSARLGLAASYPLNPSNDAARADDQAMIVATLVASTAPRRAAGLQFLFSPYDIGSFAEGAYRIVLPAQVLRADFKPRYRLDFGGAPAGDLRADPLADFPADIPKMAP